MRNILITAALTIGALYLLVLDPTLMHTFYDPALRAANVNVVHAPAALLVTYGLLLLFFMGGNGEKDAINNLRRGVNLQNDALNTLRTDIRNATSKMVAADDSRLTQRAGQMLERIITLPVSERETIRGLLADLPKLLDAVHEIGDEHDLDRRAEEIESLATIAEKMCRVVATPDLAGVDGKLKEIGDGLDAVSEIMEDHDMDASIDAIDQVVELGEKLQKLRAA